MNWADVVAMGALLPGVEVGTSYGRPALKVRGKAIAAAGKLPWSAWAKASATGTCTR